ncbi:hypothetical protein C2845_PM10G08660 [Panicum miliaceum]|uniref:Polygalacturonase n=1 Tax=Panicum miliaceum TaxID=4540 RepID=A0A3L6PBK9_PANMI|nr:hypothetical protein C2845_PM10G08660 [Panicum miliaceum]
MIKEMKRRSTPNASCANATFVHFALLLLVAASPSFLQHCLARRESHHRPPPAPVMPPPPPPSAATFSVLDYGAAGDGATDDTKASADKLHLIN